MIGRFRKVSFPVPNSSNAMIQRGVETPTGSGDEGEIGEAEVSAGLRVWRVEAACRGFESAASGGAKDQRGLKKFSGATKQQAGNFDLGMVAARSGSRYERVKGRCEAPTPDMTVEPAA